jgi:hypothetical protein
VDAPDWDAPDWDAVVAHIVHMTGWEWDHVEETLTAARLSALQAEWERHPPMPLLFAAWLGVKRKGTQAELVERMMGSGNGFP